MAECKTKKLKAFAGKYWPCDVMNTCVNVYVGVAYNNVLHIDIGASAPSKPHIPVSSVSLDR